MISSIFLAASSLRQVLIKIFAACLCAGFNSLKEMPSGFQLEKNGNCTFHQIQTGKV